jgi:hypothetical protein
MDATPLKNIPAPDAEISSPRPTATPSVCIRGLDCLYSRDKKIRKAIWGNEKKAKKKIET